MNAAYREIPGLVSPHSLAEHLALATKEEGSDRQVDVAGARLHELYFKIITPSDGAVLETGALRALIEKRWASVDGWWQNEMRPAALRARGWAVLARMNAEMRTFVLESHDSGAVFGWEPLIAIDCYEHAYWADFGTRKDAYLEAVYKHLNWPAINADYAVG